MERRLAPQCSCRRGQMVLKCAGPKAYHTGRWYCKCPLGQDHEGGFIWYDEYHPPWLGTSENSSYCSASNYQGQFSDHASTSTAIDSQPSTSQAPIRAYRDNDVHIPLYFLLAITIVFGVVLGKLI